MTLTNITNTTSEDHQAISAFRTPDPAAVPNRRPYGMCVRYGLCGARDAAPRQLSPDGFICTLKRHTKSITSKTLL